MSPDSQAQRVAIVGGGLAGLAAAVALSDTRVDVELFEARKQLGGRAGSYRDDATGELVDHCQHVSMGCCTSFADFCRKTETQKFFKRYSRLYFFSADGRRCEFSAAAFLPAPFHLAPSLFRMRYLSFGDRVSVGRALWKLARTRNSEHLQQTTIGRWLRENRQSEAAIRRFWSVVLVSALGESLDKASCAAARKVFFDGFLANRKAYEIEVPTVSLAELYDGHVARWLRDRGVEVSVERPVAAVDFSQRQVRGLRFTDGSQRAFDFVILAVPWRQLNSLFRLDSVQADSVQADSVQADSVQAVIRPDGLARIESSPITAVHLWFDRPITRLPHAVIVDRLSQWLFSRGQRHVQGTTGCHAFQVVISAARDLAGRSKEEIRDEVVADLTAIWPETAGATLVRWQLITQRHAVFSYGPGLDAIRPDPVTRVANLFLAGDWTATGWPATMEGAVRSGYLAAQRVLDAAGDPRDFLVDDLPPGRLVRWMFRRRC